MKNIRFLLFLSLLTFSNQTFGQEVSEVQIQFVNNFMTSVQAHNLKTTLKYTDKSYRKEQLKFLGGNKEQFINELFGGTDVLTEKFVNTRFVNITKIEVAEIVEWEDGSFEYVFRIRDGKNDFLSSLFLRKSKNKFGFVGAVG